MITNPMDLLNFDIIGVPYVKNGRDPRTGFDCYGLVQWGLAQRGLVLDDNSVEAVSFLKQRHLGKFLPWPCELEPWDVLLISNEDEPGYDFVTHVALVVSRDEALHTGIALGGVVLSRINIYISKIRKAVRFDLP